MHGVHTSLHSSLLSTSLRSTLASLVRRSLVRRSSRVASKQLRKLEHIKYLPNTHLARWSAFRGSALISSKTALAEIGLFLTLALLAPIYVVVAGAPTLVLLCVGFIRGVVGWREAALHLFHLLFGLFATSALVSLAVGIAYFHETAMDNIEIFGPMVIYLAAGWLYFTTSWQVFVDTRHRTRSLAWDALTSPHSAFHTLYKIWCCPTPRRSWSDKDSFLHAPSLSDDGEESDPMPTAESTADGDDNARYQDQYIPSLSYDAPNHGLDNSDELSSTRYDVLDSESYSGLLESSYSNLVLVEDQLDKTRDHFLKLINRLSRTSSLDIFLWVFAVPLLLAVLQACLVPFRRMARDEDFAPNEHNADRVIFVTSFYSFVVGVFFILAYLSRSVRALTGAAAAFETFSLFYLSSDTPLIKTKSGAAKSGTRWSFVVDSVPTMNLWVSIKSRLQKRADFAVSNLTGGAGLAVLLLLALTFTNVVLVFGRSVSDRSGAISVVSLLDILLAAGTLLLIIRAGLRIDSVKRSDDAWLTARRYDLLRRKEAVEGGKATSRMAPELMATVASMLDNFAASDAVRAPLRILGNSVSGSLVNQVVILSGLGFGSALLEIISF